MRTNIFNLIARAIDGARATESPHVVSEDRYCVDAVPNFSTRKIRVEVWETRTVSRQKIVDTRLDSLVFPL